MLFDMKEIIYCALFFIIGISAVGIGVALAARCFAFVMGL